MMTVVARRFFFLAFTFALLCKALSVASAQSLSEADMSHRMIDAFNAGRVDEALPYAQQLRAIYEQELSPDDSTLEKKLYNIAEVYRVAARTDDAISLFRRVLAIRERLYAPDHPNVGEVLMMIGRALIDEGRFAEAEPIIKRTVAIAERLRNPVYVATALDNLSVIYGRQERYTDAIPLAERALAEQKRTLKADDPQLVAELQNLGLYYHKVGRDAEAEPMLLRAIAIDQKQVQRIGPNILTETELQTALAALADFYRDRGRLAEAEKLYLEQANVIQKWYGPDHGSVAGALINLADLYRRERKFPEAEIAYTRALSIAKKRFSFSREPIAVQALNDLTSIYVAQGRYGDALALVRESISRGTAATDVALPALFGADCTRLIAHDEALDDSLNVLQRAKESTTGQAVKALNARLAAGTGRLADLVRADQDLAAENKALDAKLLALLSAPAAKRDVATEQLVRNRLAAIAQQRDQLSQVFAREFPDYTALSRPMALTVRDVQGLLASDEALIVTSLGAKSYLWVISREKAEWKELGISADEVARQVSTLRTQLDPDHPKPFDARASFALYQKVLGPVAETFGGKKRLSFVLDGSLTSLPPQLLVQSNPAGKDHRSVDWLVRSHAVTVLPSVESLKVLRGKIVAAAGQKPLIGFADPWFNPERPSAQIVASLSASRGIHGTVADLATLKTALAQLPDTADELKRVGASVQADTADLYFARGATETKVKQSALDQYRIVYFATHGLLAGDVQTFAKLNAEPALVLSLPQQPTALDDGLLTASEVAQLKLNAEWVVLSACSTASGDKPGAEALSGLARAFFYAGGRSLLVSNWVVESDSTVALMAGTFAAAGDPRLSHAEALQKAMLTMIDNPQHPDWADPKYWAPFVVVGEPAKP